MRVLLADSNHPVLHKTLQAASLTCDLFWDKTDQELIALLPQYDALILRSKFKITKTIIDACPKLKCIGRVGAGMENIDVTYAESKGVRCLSVPEGNRDAVGEHAIGMLLMLLNNLKKADAEVRAGVWRREENRGYEIKDKTVGIIGYGNTGSVFAKKLSGFECKILVYDKYKNNLSNDFVRQCEMQSLFDECDIVSLHLPLTDETNYLVNTDFITQFKKPIYLVNTARGKCLNTTDLVAAIKSGKILGACLDVLEYETVSFEATSNNANREILNYLFGSDQVILSPHIAGWTHESNYKMSRLIAEKMISVLKNQ
jgi:D-3-phosphoglycerate dehydrogenase / 2-oxoglutarate reductase